MGLWEDEDERDPHHQPDRRTTHDAQLRLFSPDGRFLSQGSNPANMNKSLIDKAPFAPVIKASGSL